MDHSVKSDPDAAGDAPHSRNFQSLVEEATIKWDHNLSPGSISSQLVNAINQELNSRANIKFIKRLARFNDAIFSRYRLSQTFGYDPDLDAGRIALFRIIDTNSFAAIDWRMQSKINISLNSFKTAADLGIKVELLPAYIAARTFSPNRITSIALTELNNWAHSVCQVPRVSSPSSVKSPDSSNLSTKQRRESHSWTPNRPRKAASIDQHSRSTSSSSYDRGSVELSEDGTPEATESSSESEATPSFGTNARASNGPSAKIGRDPNASSEPDNSETQRNRSNFQLQRLLDNQPLDILEKGVRAGVNLLDQIKEPLHPRSEESQEASMWLDRIDGVQKQAVKSRTIVGVVGNTGAGKSSIINALLDEERLVPTNCMRACTAVITEISYNDQSVPYQAAIEFIDKADWAKELKILFDDLIDSSTGRLNWESRDQDTDSGIAYAKIKAVYPKLTKEMMEQSSVESLLTHQNARVLGKTWNLSERNSTVFYKKLQNIIDSKEKTEEEETKEDGKQKKRPKEPAYWPLIKTVKLYVKSPALETGAVIVDLPGVHDSNAARAKVAENYMKQCTGLWIVAPINRAVDDKAAKTLLGETFKRQLKMDGGFSTVTFICSKTDDISVMEATDSLGLEDEFEKYEERLDKLNSEIKTSKRDLRDLKQEKQDITDEVEVAMEQVDEYETLKEDIEDGKTVFKPTSSVGSKRKRVDESSSREKKRRSSGDDSQAESGSTSDSDFDGSNEGHGDGNDKDEFQAPLTLEDVTAEIDRLKKLRREGRDKKLKIDEKMKPLQSRINELQHQVAEIDIEKRSACISGRNRYSQQAIKTDYASGIRELDEEIAEEEDAANFNPDEERRDYEEVARNLPVFCVSSRAYHKLQGRFRQESHVPGFKIGEDTQIPQLQQHCRDLTIKGRTNTCHNFLSTLSQLLNSLSLWAANDGTGSNVSADMRSREERNLQQEIAKLASDFDKSVEDTGKELRTELAEQIYDKFDSAVQAAKQAAMPTVQKWGAPVNRDNPPAGGVHFMTYAAICRRNGVYRNARGQFDWNTDLMEPLLKQVVSGWERAFVRRVPAVMKQMVKDVSNVVRKFHDTVSSRAQKIGAAGAKMYLLQEQMQVYEREIQRICDASVESLNARQKEANREFRPVIESEMQPVYERCMGDGGTGVSKRRKGYMEEHVMQQKEEMFKDSVDSVKVSLNAAARDCCLQIEKQLDENILASLKRDYMSAFGWSAANIQLLPKADRMMRKDVQDRVWSAEALYQRVVDPDDTMEDGPYEDESMSVDRRLKTEDEAWDERHSASASVKKEDLGAEPASEEHAEHNEARDKTLADTDRSTKEESPPNFKASHEPEIKREARDSGVDILADDHASPSQSPSPQPDGRYMRSSAGGALQDRSLSSVNEQQLKSGFDDTVKYTMDRIRDEVSDPPNGEDCSDDEEERLPDMDTLFSRRANKVKMEEE